jgi:site-specific DNA-cytosine methylase
VAVILVAVAKLLWFVKSKRAQTSDDDETWIAGGVAPTLNAFDMGDTRATVIILDGTRVGDVRVYEDSVMQTVIQRWGTGGGNVPMIFEPTSQAVAFDTFNQTVSDTNQTIKAHSANNENIGTVFQTSVVRRLTPTECERLQGFPDGWTDGQSDAPRYKQMGNAVAVPVVEWIINRIIK